MCCKLLGTCKRTEISEIFSGQDFPTKQHLFCAGNWFKATSALHLPLRRGANREQMVQCGGKSGLQEKLRIKHPPAESSAACFRRKRKTEVLGQKIYNTSSAWRIPLIRAASYVHPFTAEGSAHLLSFSSLIWFLRAVLCWTNERGYCCIFLQFLLSCTLEANLSEFLPA